MNIDIIVAKLQKRGMSEITAKDFANKLNTMSKEIGVPVKNLVEDFNDFSLNELGEFLTNTVSIKGYKTGKVIKRTSSDIVSRTIIK
jgi:hypothetical protein